MQSIPQGYIPANRVEAALHIETNKTTSGKGDLAYLSTTNPVVDLYAAQGALRGDPLTFLAFFEKAIDVSLKHAVASLFKLRDIRNGQGERDLFRVGLCCLEVKRFDVSTLFEAIIHYGRADDLFCFRYSTSLEKVADYLSALLKVIDNPNDPSSIKLQSQYPVLWSQRYNVIKWLPKRFGTRASASKKFVVSLIRRKLKWTPKKYRQTLVNFLAGSLVETKLTDKNYDAIDFNKVPSKASRVYKKAFSRNITERYAQWLDDLSEGKEGVKVNAGAIYPYELVSNYAYGSVNEEEIKLNNAQWKALPDYFHTSNNLNVLPMVDMSGSMDCRLPNSTKKVMDAAVSLGIYLSEHNQGPYKNALLTFNDTPRLFTMADCPTLHDKCKRILEMNGNWYGTTDIRKGLQKVFRYSIDHKLTYDEQPDMLVILSDMDFDKGVYIDKDKRDSIINSSLPKWVVQTTENEGCAKTLIEEIQEDAKVLGCKIPKVVYWNLNHNGTFQCTVHQEGVVQLSGFSPSVMKDVLASLDELTPMSLVNKALNVYHQQLQELNPAYDLAFTNHVEDIGKDVDTYIINRVCNKKKDVKQKSYILS